MRKDTHRPRSIVEQANRLTRRSALATTTPAPVPEQAARRWGMEEWTRRINTLLELGLNYAQAATWAVTNEETDTLAAQLTRYMDSGFTPEEALPWWTAAFHEEDAVQWASAGWVPGQVWQLMRALTYRYSDTYNCSSYTDILASWATSKVTPQRAILYARAGIHVHDAARHGAQPLDDTLELEVLAALRGYEQGC